MILKEVKRFQFCNDTYVILENREKIMGVWSWNYWLTIKGYGRIEHLFGLCHVTKEYGKSYDFENYVLNNLDSYYEDITGESFAEVHARYEAIKED